MRKYALIGAVACALTLSACADDTTNSPDTSTPATTTTTTTTTTTPTRTTESTSPETDSAVAEYWLRVDREGYLTMNVKENYTDEQLEKAFLEVRRIYSNTEEGGWHVQINCGDSQSAQGGPRQANGKFALDNLGAARTGLGVGEYEFDPLPNRAPCSPEPVDSAAVDMSKCSEAGSPESSPEMAQAFASLPPRENVELLSTMATTHSDNRSMVAAIYYVCAPELVGDELKDFATELAISLQSMPFAETVYSMSVHNFYGTETLGAVRAQPFQQYNFNESVNPSALRPAWEELPR